MLKINRCLTSVIVLIVLVLSACQQTPPLPTPTNPPVLPTATSPVSSTATPPALPTPTLPPAATATTAASGVRTCDFVPGKSTPLLIPPPSVPPAVSPSPTPMAFNLGAANAGPLERQMTVFNLIVKEITDHYYSTTYNGVDWTALQAKYKGLIQQGLTLPDFYQAMSQMVGELGDKASFYQGPSDPVAPTAAVNSVVGIGGSLGMTGNNGGIPVLHWVYSGSPAEQAGLKSHDLLLKVDGGPFLDEKGTPRTLGAEGTTVVVTVQTPGQAPRDVKIVRQKVSFTQMVDDCLVAGTSIGYIRWNDIDNIATIYQTMAELKKMNAASPLQGLIIDLRSNSGGAMNNLQPLLGLFTSGSFGSFIAPRGDSAPLPFASDANDVAGSQKLALVVLQDKDTGLAPTSAGVLQLAGRARIVGQTAASPLFAMWCDDTSDGSKLCVPNGVFQPQGKPLDYWKQTGVVPDVHVDGRWDQYTEANDPYLAKAIDLLTQK